MVAQTRRSKYVDAVRTRMAERCHATNAQLADDLRKVYPDLSDTTVHRITQRLLVDAQLSLAPRAECGAKRFDVNTSSHDHFECTTCQQLIDISVSSNFREELQSSLGGCRIGESLTIRGNCQKCLAKKEVNNGTN